MLPNLLASCLNWLCDICKDVVHKFGKWYNSDTYFVNKYMIMALEISETRRPMVVISARKQYQKVLKLT